MRFERVTLRYPGSSCQPCDLQRTVKPVDLGPDLPKKNLRKNPKFGINFS